MKYLLLSIAVLSQLLVSVGGEPKIIEQSESYTLIALTDSTTLEMYEKDSIIVVMTVCAPQCSSYACVYNKEWVFAHPITPTVTSIFPLATLNKKTGAIEWKNNDDWEY